MRKINLNMNINIHIMNRIIPDPEEYFKEYKNKFIEVDLLEIEKDIRKDQQYIVVSYVEPDPSFASLWECLCTENFLKQIGDKIYEQCIKQNDWNFYYQKYKEFKEINYEPLRKEFEEKYGEEYDSIRICKFYQAFPSLKQAQKFANSLVKNNKLFDVYIQEMGKWVPFKPTSQMCKESTHTDEKMNKVMHAHIYHKNKAKEYLQARKQVLLEKAIKEGAKPKTAYEKFDKLNISNHVKDDSKIDLKMNSTNDSKKFLQELIDVELQSENKDILNPDFVLQISNDPNKVIEVLKSRMQRYKAFENQLKEKENELNMKEKKMKEEVKVLKTKIKKLTSTKNKQ